MATVPSNTVFSRKQIDQQIHDDLEAGYRIPGILMAIMIFGLASMVLSVWIAT